MTFRPDLYRICKAACIACLLMIINPGKAVAWGGYGYGYHHGYGHYGHHSGVHYSHHGGGSTAGYVILGLLGVLVLSHILDNDRYYRHERVTRIQPLTEYPRTTRRPEPYPRVQSRPPQKAPVYGSEQGWQALGIGNAKQAMQIFAVQSQQNLQSGIPKIGFALATAANGERERAVWSMRRAVKSDPGALDQIVIDKNLENMLGELREQYQAKAEILPENKHDGFMVAALSYMQQDYDSARESIVDSDQTPSAVNLRRLLASIKR